MRCGNGHVDQYGRNGRCKQCNRNDQRRYRRKQNVMMFPADPLRKRVLERASRYRNGRNATDTGVGHLGRLYAERYGMTYDEGDNAIRSLLNKGAKTIKEETADRWCCFLDIHPMELWPESWMLVDA